MVAHRSRLQQTGAASLSWHSSAVCLAPHQSCSGARGRPRLLQSGASVSAAANPPSSAKHGPGHRSQLALEGLPVVSHLLQGIPADRLAPLPGHLAQMEGTPLTADNLKRACASSMPPDSTTLSKSKARAQAGGVDLIFAEPRAPSLAPSASTEPRRHHEHATAARQPA